MALLLGRGTTIGYKVGSGSFLPIATARSIEINEALGEVESTVLATTGCKPYLPTLAECDGSLTMLHDTANAACIALQGYVGTPVVLTFLITYSDASTSTFTGFVKGYSLSSIENESLIEATVPFRINSFPTPGSGS